MTPTPAPADTPRPTPAAVSPSEALALLQGRPFATVLSHGSLVVELYAPKGRDAQQPHSRDELYVVVSGSGLFDNGGTVTPFAAGDVIFVPARRPHRFTRFSDDFATWVVFYGPEGGEAP